VQRSTPEVAKREGRKQKGKRREGGKKRRIDRE
jgi:hypothetical protein